MEHSANGNPDAQRRDLEFLALLGKHELQLSACVHALVPSWHDAEDIIQDTRGQLWREFGKYRLGSDFGAWACTIARYSVRAYVKKNQRKPLLLSSDLGEALMPQVMETAAEADLRLRLLAECAGKLGGDARDLLRRCYSEGEKIKDIAAAVGRSLAGTYQALSRIRRELFDCMQERLRREENR